MAKRFVDTDIWNKSWYQELTLKEKILVKYIFENCDCAGVWDINFRLATFIIGEPISLTDIDSINKKNLLFEVFNTDKIFVIDFIKFQYGTLSENCKPHKPIIEKLKKYGFYERVLKGFPKGYETLEEKEKEKEILDPYTDNSVIEKFKSEHFKNFGTKLYLTGQQRQRIMELNAEIDDFIVTIPEAFTKIKNIDFDLPNFKPNSAWLLRDNNYTNVLNGLYDGKKKQDIWEELREKERLRNGKT